MRILLFIFFVFLFGNILSGQDKVDTINIYRKKAGTPFRKYYFFWFMPTHSGSFSYNVHNRQDSLVIEDDSSYYMKAYDRKNRIILEGMKTKNQSYLIGEVKFYYKNGNIKRIEHYAYLREYKRPCEDTNGYVFDGITKGDSTQYFRRNGSLKKVEFYFLKSDCNKNHDWDLRRKITHYSRKRKPNRILDRRCNSCW